MIKRDGAKNRMARMQGRKVSECSLCGDDSGISECGACGETLCRDCRMEHDCLKEEKGGEDEDDG